MLCICVSVCPQVFECVEEKRGENVLRKKGENKIKGEGRGLIFLKIISHSVCFIWKVRERQFRVLSRG